MAITDGLATGCGDLQASGGIKYIFIREWNSTGSPDQIALAAGGTGSITSIADSGGSTSTWGVFETKLESPVLSVSGTAVGNANTYECTLAFNLPHFDLARRTRISELEGKCLQVMVQDTNDTYFVIGIGNTLTGGPRTYVGTATDPVVINASGLTVVIK